MTEICPRPYESCYKPRCALKKHCPVLHGAIFTPQHFKVTTACTWVTSRRDATQAQPPIQIHKVLNTFTYVSDTTLPVFSISPLSNHRHPFSTIIRRGATRSHPSQQHQSKPPSRGARSETNAHPNAASAQHRPALRLIPSTRERTTHCML